MSREPGLIWLIRANHQIDLYALVEQVGQCLGEFGLKTLNSGFIEYPPGERERMESVFGTRLPFKWEGGQFIPPENVTECTMWQHVKPLFSWNNEIFDLVHYLNSHNLVRAVGIIGFAAGRLNPEGRRYRMLTVITDALAQRCTEILDTQEIQGLLFCRNWPFFYNGEPQFRWKKTEVWEYFPEDEQTDLPNGMNITQHIMDMVTTLNYPGETLTGENLRWAEQVNTLEALRLEFLEDRGVFGIRMVDETFAWLPESLISSMAVPRHFSEIWNYFRCPSWEEFVRFHQVAVTSGSTTDVLSKMGREPLAVLPGHRKAGYCPYREGECEILVFDGVSENMLPIFIITSDGVELSYALKEKERGTF